MAASTHYVFFDESLFSQYRQESFIFMFSMIQGDYLSRYIYPTFWLENIFYLSIQSSRNIRYEIFWNE